jgi:hypothetical protein
MRGPTDLSVADAYFDSMVRHNMSRRPTPPNSNDLQNSRSPQHTEDAEEIDLAWGAEEVAITIFGPASPSSTENRRRRRRVFCMHEQYVKALSEAKLRKRPPPANIGWVSLPQCNRIILSKSAYRAFVASQLEDKR